ncbi:MAG: hypothetical protein R3185_00335, partial [Candidatus Thermoplasmatota archaeon]|nr:hypothetical protein [Candidatus Thermoplasmatota archaeon]
MTPERRRTGIASAGEAKRITPKGTLVAIGGNEDKSADLEVLATICGLPEGGTDVVELIPTASRARARCSPSPVTHTAPS